MQKVQENCELIGQNMRNEMQPIGLMAKSELWGMSASDLQTLIKFYQEAPKIYKHYSKAAEIL